jgi:hypothetical protein
LTVSGVVSAVVDDRITIQLSATSAGVVVLEKSEAVVIK